MSESIESATRDYLRVLAREMPEGELDLPFTPFGCGLVFMRKTKELFDRWQKGEQVLDENHMEAGNPITIEVFGERRAGVIVREAEDTVLVSLNRALSVPGFAKPQTRVWAERPS